MEIPMSSFVIIVLLAIIVILLMDLKFEIRFEKDLKEAKQLDELSNTEYKVLELLAFGKSNQQIAEEMFISVTTVKKHVTTIFKKLGISKRSEARKFKGHFEQKKPHNT